MSRAPSGRAYLVAGSRPWNRRVFEETLRGYPGRWHFVGSREDLTVATVERIAPRYVFFLHWSWKVPATVFERWECVVFHMTDVPYGRGGSPLQNLIVRGHRRTKLSALRMTGELDAGPVYLKEDLSLDGTAEQVYVRAAELSAKMIARIVRERIQPLPQSGEVVKFGRRTPEQSAIPAELDSARALYDFIRMLDCDGYPRAFLEHGGLRFEFRDAALEADEVRATVRVRPAAAAGESE